MTATTLTDLIEAARSTGYAASELVETVLREYIAERPSRGKADTVSAGIVSRCAGRIGIVATAGRKVRGDDGWVIEWTVRPPTTDAERDLIARAILRRWLDRVQAGNAAGPDDERARAEYDAAQTRLQTVSAQVRAAIAH